MNEPLHCVNHPHVETHLRCNKCGQPICTRCAVQTPVGYRCRDCINAQQRLFYADFRPRYYLIAAAVALPLALIAGWLIPRLGWFAIILGPVVGGGIAEAVHWAIQRRRGQYTWLVVCGAIVVGALPGLVASLLSLLGLAVLSSGSIGYLAGGLIRLLWSGVYLVTGVGAAYARLHTGKRR